MSDSKRLTVTVALPVPVPRLFDYALSADKVSPAIGTRVRVAFGPRELIGVVAGVAPDNAGRELKPVEAVLDDTPLFDHELWASLGWAASYYHHPLGEVLAAALPAPLRRGDALPDTDEPALRLTSAGRSALTDASVRAGPGRDLLQRLADGPLTITELSGHDGQRLRAVAGRLRRRGLLETCRLPWTAPPHPNLAGPPLNPAQQAAVGRLEALHGGGFHGLLLEGVTGSGKTEVYLHAIGDVLAAGRQALVLVPEIALTPQALARYRERLGGSVFALHSGLSDGERARVWARLQRGEPGVVIGTRSAVFTPLPRAGLIVVDEEHDGSYKQADGFRYHARDLALVRGKALAVPVLLGSATPSLESLALVADGRLEHCRLATRAVELSRLPEPRLVDIRQQRLLAGLSGTALQALADTLARGEQALVFRNRRGYAPVLTCTACGWHAVCPRCDRAMTLHRQPAPWLLCHHCGQRQRPPAHCPECAASELSTRGVGTERLQVELAERFPDYPVLRIDRDEARSARALDALLEQVAGGEPAIVVGTQLLAKGHDWPALTLVIVVDADSGLFSADFRAPERLAQQLTQVAGRAGRGDRPGTVLIQTRQPQHPFWPRWLADGYAGVAAAELDERRASALPPFRQQALLAAEARDNGALAAFFTAVLALPIALPAGVDRLGPLPAPMPRRAGHHRAQLLLESDARPPLHAFLRALLPAIHALSPARKVRWSLDVDPYDLY